MLNLEDLSQFVAFYQYGTLTKVAEEFHISQPTVTRTMKRIEEAFGVPLITHSVNKIEINDTGKVAAEAAIRLLSSANQCEAEVKEFDKKLHTITVDSCAPAPLWNFIPRLSRKQSDKTISSKLVDDMSELEENLLTHECNVAILTHPVKADGITCVKYLEEHLSACVPPTHELAKYKEVTISQLNGYNCVLSSDLGFWGKYCKREMPSSRFFEQTDEEAFRTLIKESTLLCFTTNLVTDTGNVLGDRIVIPITDEEVNVTYYICSWEDQLFTV